ncbi:YdbL family protein [Sphingomonas sp. HDW15A]|uniref:YdbL family protein n=1 Tax=Sphingomonas sp. HDW15A TaxID=2714942 RepID=UPI00140A20D5|nr:YdbL family protein [Sphingomonas sp. HDW15A]QIK96331.1 YdbL family protein [Sphingomonas sp. HDW15A]
MRLLLVLAGVAALAGPALAQPEQSAARAAGQVGERFDGYLGIVSAVPPAVRSQVNAINIKRRALYSQLGARRGVAPGDVGVTAGCELLGGVAVGEAYLLPDGRWRRRAAGESAPRPDYCG